MKPLSVSSKENDAHLRAAMQLAKRGLGNTGPNPSVGCVIVDKAGRVVGRGNTQMGGRPHAEIMALEMAGDAAAGGIAYLSLEPCCHAGKSGPCTEALIKAGIKKAVIAQRDPDPRVNGGGIRALQAAGIEVEEIPLPEAAEIAAGFIHRVQTGFPLFISKIAASMDGKIALANGQSKWITSESARNLGHLWRARCDAIMTSIGTVLADDPELTCRLPGCRSPIRIVVDKDFRLPLHSRLMKTIDQAPLWIIASERVPEKDKFLLLYEAFHRNGNMKILTCPLDYAGKFNLRAMAKILGEEGLSTILIEAGAKFNTAMLKAGLVQRLLWFQADKILGGDAKAAINDLGLTRLEDSYSLQKVEEGSVGDDRWFYYNLGGRCLQAS